MASAATHAVYLEGILLALGFIPVEVFHFRTPPQARIEDFQTQFYLGVESRLLNFEANHGYLQSWSATVLISVTLVSVIFAFVDQAVKSVSNRRSHFIQRQAASRGGDVVCHFFTPGRGVFRGEGKDSTSSLPPLESVHG